MPAITALRLPVLWDEFELPNPLQTPSTVLTTGDPAWAWEPAPPGLGVPDCDVPRGEPAPGWDVDHVVLLVPDIETATEVIGEAGASPRLRIEVKGRPTAFFRVGPLLEVIESPVRAPSLYGVALVTDTPLEVVALRWRALGREVTDPRPAIQPGRRILTVRSLDAGFAVMSPDREAPAPAPGD